MKCWEYGELEPGGEVEAYIIDSDGDMVAQFWAVAPEDGRLMAAAPRLAEAVKHCVRVIESLPEDSLGYDASEGWPHRDELVYHLRAALREAGIE